MSWSLHTQKLLRELHRYLKLAPLDGCHVLVLLDLPLGVHLRLVPKF